jgi:hypothetical protein
MPYNANLTRIKQILEITDALPDTELTADQAAAYAEINSILKFHGFTVPLASPSDDVKEAEAYIGASKFRGRRHSATALTESEKFYAEGQRALTRYIEAEKYQPYIGRV